MLNALKRWWPYALFAMGILAVLAFSTLAPSYDGCTANYHEQATDPEKGKPKPEVHRTFSERGALFLECEGEFIHANEGVITAVSTIFIALFTLALWRSTDRLWVAGEKQIELTGESVRISARAVLWVDKWTVRNFEANQAPVVEYKLTNTGRTHAEIIAIRAGYGISAEDKVPSAPPDGPEDPTAPGIVGPNATVDMEVMIKDPLTPEEYRDIANGQKFLFLYGRISYRDEFRWTCEVAYGAQFGNFGDGIPAIVFMKRPGYTYVRWHPPKQNG